MICINNHFFVMFWCFGADQKLWHFIDFNGEHWFETSTKDNVNFSLKKKCEIWMQDFELNFNDNDQNFWLIDSSL